MKLVLFLLYNFTFAYIALSKPLEDDLVGVSSQKINQLITQAILGFRDIILHGDPDMGYPIMQPHQLGDIQWKYDEKTGKQKLNFQAENVKLNGLSDYQLEEVNVHLKRLHLSFILKLENLEIEGSYKLNGYAFNNWLPIYGDGHFTFGSNELYLYTSIKLSLELSKVVVEDVQAQFYFGSYPYFQVEAEGLMDLPAEFNTEYLNEKFTESYFKSKPEIEKFISKYAAKIVQEKISGMSLNELLEFLDYYAKKT